MNRTTKTYRRRALLLGLVCLYLPSSAHTQSIQIAQDSRSDYVIFVAKDAVEVVSYAAQELQHYVTEATGATLPIETDEEIGRRGRAIFVGESPFTQTERKQLRSLKPESFVIAARPGRLCLVGDDSPGDPLSVTHSGDIARAGTLFAVYEFLERYLGVQWLHPGEFGENVPTGRTLVVPEGRVVEQPSFVRRIFHSYGGYRRSDGEISQEEFMKWCRRNKLGMGIDGFNHHVWDRLIPKRRDYTAHPEYFTMTGGERTGVINKLCTANVEVRRLCVSRAAAHIRKHGVDVYSLSPTDGGGFCECPKCQGMDAPGRIGHKGRVVLTDRMLDFYEEIGRLLIARHPRQLFGGYIYAAYRDLPALRTYCLPDTFVATYVFNHSYTAVNAKWESEFQQMRDWHRELPNIKGWTFYSFPTGGEGKDQLMGPPFSRADVIAKLVRTMGESNYLGVKICNWCHWQIPLDYYLLARLMWDADQNVEELTRRYFDGMYGAGSRYVREYFDSGGGYWRQLNEDGAQDPKASPDERFQSFRTIIQRCRDLLREAEARAAGLPKKRVAKLMQHFRDSPKIYQGLIETYQPDRYVRLPEIWRFKIDPKAIGEKQGWHAASFDDSDWDKLSICQSWEYQGYGAKHPLAKSPQNGYDGAAWYRCTFTVNERKKGECVVLQLGATDDECWVHLNGSKVGARELPGPHRVAEAARLDVTAGVRWGEQNTLAVRMVDGGRWGGMCRPAFLVLESRD